MDGSPYAHFQRRKLEEIKFQINKRLTAEYLDRVDVDFIVDELTYDIEVKLRERLLSERVYNKSKVVTIDVYSSWWQHFKDQHMPRWFKKRFPVRWTKKSSTVEFKVDAVYPNPSPALGNSQYVIELKEGAWKYE